MNQAYDKGDLLALLELQLQIEQINPAALEGMARERVIHYNTVLTGQLQRLRDELEELVVPFTMTMGAHSVRDSYVYMNDKPGFGFDIDWDYARTHTA